MKRYKLFRNSYDFAGRPLHDDLVEYDQGQWVRYEDAQAEIERLQALCAEIGLRAVSMRPFIIGEQVSAFIEEFPEYKEWFNEDGSVK